MARSSFTTPGQSFRQAYTGLQDFPALQARSNETYDRSWDAANDFMSRGDPNHAQARMNITQSKISPWAPFFQALDDQGVSRIGQDAERPHGIADNPQWWGEGSEAQATGLGNGGQSPYAQSSNIGNHQRLSRAIKSIKG